MDPNLFLYYSSVCMQLVSMCFPALLIYLIHNSSDMLPNINMLYYGVYEDFMSYGDWYWASTNIYPILWCLIQCFLILRSFSKVFLRTYLGKELLRNRLTLGKIIFQKRAWRRTLRSDATFGNWKSYKNDEKCFLFHDKSSFRSQDI